jgi:hypothetical protein
MTRIVIKMPVRTLETARFQRINIGQIGISLALFSGESFELLAEK